MENDYYGLQRQIWRFIRTQRKEISELTETNKIDVDTWTSYLTQLFKTSDNQTLQETPEITTEKVIVTTEEITKALEKLKNRKSLGPDKIPNEY